MKQEQTRIKLRTKIQDKRENTGKQELLNRTGTNKIKQEFTKRKKLELTRQKEDQTG